MTHETNPESMVTLRTADGVWYELPVAVLEQGRIHDADQLAEVRRLRAGAGGTAPTEARGDEAPAYLLAEADVAAYQADDARAAELTAANEVTGFAGRPVYVWLTPSNKADQSPGHSGGYRLLNVQPSPFGDRAASPGSDWLWRGDH